MTDVAIDRLIRDLSADLAPVSRLRPPWLRAASWIGVCLVLALGLASFGNLAAVVARMGAAPDMWLAGLGSTLTMVLAAVATFELCLPDRKSTWALLPLPGLVVWLGAAGLGCLRSWAIPGVHSASLTESGDCLGFILGLSLPLSLLTLWMIRRAYPLRPNLTAAVGGLASAAAAATLLNLFHPYDASASDLAVHLLAVAAVILANNLFGGRVLKGGTAELRPEPSKNR